MYFYYDSHVIDSNKHSLKGVIGCDMHFYKLFKLKCVLAECVHNHPIMMKIHPVFFFYLIKSLPLSHIKPFSDACGIKQTEATPTIVDWH